MAHFSYFAGASALSDFRKTRLLAALQALEADVADVEGRYVHFVSSDAPLAAQDSERLEALLTYGDPFESHSKGAEPFLVIPRLGTISPWASKAGDIAHNSGLVHVRRIERGIEYTRTVKARLGKLIGKTRTLSAEARAAIAGALHDRMTETVVASRAE